MMTIRTVIVLSFIFLILLANIINVSSFSYVAQVFLSAFAFIFFMVHFFNIFLKVFDFYLNKKKIKKENKKLYSDLSNWQDIPDFESKEDIELYLKNKIEKDILEEENINYSVINVNPDHYSYYSPKIESPDLILAEKIYNNFGSSYYQKYINGNSNTRREIEENLISITNQNLKEIDENDFNSSSGGQRKTRFFNSEIMKKVNEISRKDIEDYRKTYLREKFLGEINDV